MIGGGLSTSLATSISARAIAEPLWLTAPQLYQPESRDANTFAGMRIQNYNSIMKYSLEFNELGNIDNNNIGM